MPESRKLRFTVTAGQTEDGQPCCTITTSSPDRSRDRVLPAGIDLKNFVRNPVVMFAHRYGEIPVGTATSIRTTETGMEASWRWLENDEQADRVKNAWNQGVLRATSIGFVPTKTAFDSERNGYDYEQSELLEFSIVAIPANPEAVRTLGFEPVEDAVDDGGKFRYLKAAFAAGLMTSAVTAAVARKGDVSGEPDLDPVRWNPALSKAFDVTREQFPPANAELALAAKFLDCDIAQIRQGGTDVPSARMGSWLTALDEHLAHYRCEGVRNLNWKSEEQPPVWETLQLNSTRSADFLVDGTRFLRHPEEKKLVLRVRSCWFGLAVATYTRERDFTIAQDLVTRTWERAAQLNFLKGEAFSLSGEFLARTTEKFDDLFLEPKNVQGVRRIVTLVNDKGAAMENRGAILCGPPGTGKTLSLRIIRNDANATFIWVSARDFYRLGAVGGMTYAFDLAKECAPSILAFEDVDGWIESQSTDLLKTEMDGVGQSKGVVTILSTNFPEALPKALIDRPGRFHDVFKFDLPSETVRLQMLRKWLPDLSESQTAKAVKETKGYSGAHVRELARFVGVIREQENVGLGAALDQALAKIAEQRDLITSTQATGSRYRSPEFLLTKALAVADSLADVPATVDAPGPAAKSLAAQVQYTAIVSMLGRAKADIDAAIEQATALGSDEAEEGLAAARLGVVMAHVEQSVGSLAGARNLACQCLGMDDNMAGDMDTRESEATETETAVDIPQLSARQILGAIRKAGKRHSTKDQQMIQSAHDLCLDLGAACKTAPVAEETVTTANEPEALSVEIVDPEALSLELVDGTPIVAKTGEPEWTLELAEPEAPSLPISDTDFQALVASVVGQAIREVASDAAHAALLQAHGRLD